MRNPDPALLFFLGVLALDGGVVAYSFFKLLWGKLRARREARARRILFGIAAQPPGREEVTRGQARFVRRRPWIFLREFARAGDGVQLPSAARRVVSSLLEKSGMDLALIRDLNSRSRDRRLRAAAFLPLVPTKAARIALTCGLERETSRSVKLFLAAALTDLGEPYAIPSMIDALAGQPQAFQAKLRGLIAEFGDDFAALLPILVDRQEKDIQLLLIHFAGRYRSHELLQYVRSRVGAADLDISHAAFRALCSIAPSEVDHASHLRSDDALIRSLAAESLGSVPTAKSLSLLFDCLEDRLARRSVTLAVTAILRARPQHFRAVMLRCLNERRELAHVTLVEVLANFVDYLMEKMGSADPQTAGRILGEILRHGRAGAVINFLNRNADRGIESRAMRILSRALADTPALAVELGRYLDARLLPVLGLSPAPAAAPQSARRERPRIPLLLAFLAVGVGLIPLLCLARILVFPGGDFLARFLSSFNELFAAYAVILNGSYLVLLAASLAGVRRQARNRDLLRLSLLFREKVLPSISIISPAFNEEASIVESVSSLLTLRYPDYEVIVVNDGSRDATLQRLVSRFALERTDLFVHRYLATEEIRGVYASKAYPDLLVIDKANGGKADSLNAGINVARKDYFAGIDADSMLERDALLALAGQFLFSEEEVVAAGGNIMPVNGCTVRRGSLVETRIPRGPIAGFQTIEYLRAFMAGRVGWATLKSLLIISGAFGVFHRRRVIDAHGYLTRSEHYAKDTVGEDMELVVRLARGLLENGVPFDMQYTYDANCWTEIPEKLKVLNRQRDRWQRGLLDIVSFHATMIANPRYGRMGVIGFTYFLVFEVLGPWFEAEGLLALVASLALGAVGLPLFLVVFTATVLLGILVSMISLIIAEHRRTYFPLRDKVKLVLYALLENFGFRQLMSLLRTRGFIRMLARVGGWGAMERRGLATAPKPQP